MTLYHPKLCIHQYWGSVTFWCRSKSAPLTNGPDPAPDPDPTPDPIPFFNDFKDAKENLFFIFFLLPYLQVHYLQSSKLNFLLKFWVKILFCKHYFSPLYTFIWEKERIRNRTSDQWIRIQEAQKHVDPDPEHWYSAWNHLEDVQTDPSALVNIGMVDGSGELNVGRPKRIPETYTGMVLIN